MDIPMSFDDSCSWSHEKVAFKKMVMYLTQFHAPVKQFYLKYAATLAPLDTSEFFIMKTLDADKESKTSVLSSKKVIKTCRPRYACC